MSGWFEVKPSGFKSYYCYTSEDERFAPGSSFANVKYTKHLVTLKIFVNIKRKVCDVLDPDICEYENARDIEYVFIEESQPLIFRIMRDYTTTAYKYERCDATNDEFLVLKNIIKDIYVKDPNENVNVKVVVFSRLWLSELYPATKRFLEYYNNNIINIIS